MKCLIAGGTGTLGTAILEHIEKDKNWETFILSRDELKQKNTLSRFDWIDGNYICDIRDKDALKQVFEDCEPDIVFNVAALKHIDILEGFPDEAIKTNYYGAKNLYEMSRHVAAKKYAFCSTDKAVYPVNAYGMSKALAEKYLLNFIKKDTTKPYIFRWGNVIGSRGSAAQIFIDKIRRGDKIPITNSDMTRFFIPIDTAVKFMFRSFYYPVSEVFIPDMKSMNIVDFAECCAEAAEQPFPGIKIVGERPGEKVHEHIQHGISSDDVERWDKQEMVEEIRSLQDE